MVNRFPIATDTAITTFRTNILKMKVPDYNPTDIVEIVIESIRRRDGDWLKVTLDNYIASRSFVNFLDAELYRHAVVTFADDIRQILYVFSVVNLPLTANVVNIGIMGDDIVVTVA